MRKIIIPVMLFGCLYGYSQPAIEITSPISVTNNSLAYGRHLPRVELFGDGTPVVFWSKPGANAQLFLAIKNDSAFLDPIQVPTGDINPNVWGGGLGPDFAVRDSVLFVVFEKYGDAIYCVKSMDRGQSFSDPVVVYEPPAGKYATLPTIYIDEDYNPLVGFIRTNASEEDAESVLVVSTDGGESFNPPVTASAAADGSEVCECCPSGLLKDNQGNIFFSFRNNNSNTRDIWTARSTDGGQTFPLAADIDETDWFIQGCPSTGPQSYDLGTEIVSVFFSGAQDWESGVYMSTLEKSGMVSSPVDKLPTIDGMPNNQNYPRIGGHGDTLGVIWQETVSGDLEIILAYSVNGVADLLQNNVNVSDSVNSQAYPDLAYANEKFHIVYEDQNTGTIVYQVAELQQPVGISQYKHASDRIYLYPNPVREIISIRVDESCLGNTLKIIDLTGRQVFSSRIENTSMKLQVSNMGLTPGIYSCILESKLGPQSRKLIVW